MKLQDLDLNLLRLFDAVYRARSVSRAADQLGLTQPAASQGLTRLRLLLADSLFVRAPGGVAPTPRAERLAGAVRQSLAMLEDALGESRGFQAATSSRVFRMHLSDIGEARFLPQIVAALREAAPHVRLDTRPLPHREVTQALDSGQIDFALGYLPAVTETRRQPLLRDRYAVLLREGHPFAQRGGRARRTVTRLDELKKLDYCAVRSHAETLRILQLLDLEARVRLTANHFLAMPDIVRATDLVVLMPMTIAEGFEGCTVVEPRLPVDDFTVSLHWSARFEADPGNAWLRDIVVGLFSDRSPV